MMPPMPPISRLGGLLLDTCSFCCATIAWKSRIQPAVAISSTEAEFYAGDTCAKVDKYFRYVFAELNALRNGATPLYINNEAAIVITNKNWPTTCTQHIIVPRVRFS